jgi:glycosyltransferase A (GT-A) superfamily protein (DUF2064 family)
MSRKHALVLFSKYPEPGVTKTRLMEEYGGSLSAQEASDIYKAMVLDTAAVGLQALSRCRHKDGNGETFDFYISSSPRSAMTKVQKMFGAEFPAEGIHYVVDRGQNFDEHFNDCYRQLFEKGYHSVVCIGGDLPAITPDIITRAFLWLSKLEKDSPVGAMVLAPCQAGGVSLVGVTRDARVDFAGVFYNAEGVTALDALIDIAGRRKIPTALFEALSDVDYMEDLGHMISVINAMAYAAPFQPEIPVPERTLAFIRQVGLVANTPPNTSHDPRSKIDD